MVDERTSPPRSRTRLLRSVRWIPWLLRLAWIATGVAGADALATATDHRSDAVRTAVTWCAGGGWLAGVAAMAVPATVSLTATRVVVPLSVAAAVVALVAGTSATAGALFLALALVACLIALSGELGLVFVQASAYGHEERFGLRPPLGFALAAVTTWSLWTAALVTGTLLTAAQVWWLGPPLLVAGSAATIWLGPRWHVLARRWLVLVPVGLVLHDGVVLSETLMLRRSQIAHLRLAPADTGALDLTGPCSGHVLEITVREPVTVLLPPTRDAPRGRAVHASAVLAGPSRPGSVLAAARRRGLPVG